MKRILIVGGVAGGASAAGGALRALPLPALSQLIWAMTAPVPCPLSLITAGAVFAGGLRVCCPLLAKP